MSTHTETKSKYADHYVLFSVSTRTSRGCATPRILYLAELDNRSTVPTCSFTPDIEAALDINTLQDVIDFMAVFKRCLDETDRAFAFDTVNEFYYSADELDAIDMENCYGL